MSDYKMESQWFRDFLDVQQELNTDENFNIFLTEMNFNEVIKNYRKDLNSALTHMKDFTTKLYKLADIEEEGFDRKTIKSTLIEKFSEEIEDKFYIYKPTLKAYEKAVSRFYSIKMPFRDNKEEFKDAIIWESIYDYAEKFPDEKIYFISNNHKDFAIEQDDGYYSFHKDFDDKNKNIKFFKHINDFLKEIEYLRTHHFSFQEIDDIIKVIEAYLNDDINGNNVVENELYDFFSNNYFDSDFFDGWGTDSNITEFYEIKIDEYREVLEQENYFYIPISSEVNIEYSVENVNPTYEGFADENEFIQSDSREGDFVFRCLVVFNATTRRVEKIEDVSIEYL